MNWQLTLASDRKITFIFCAIKPNCTSCFFDCICTWKLMPGGAASNDSNDKRSIACDSPAILRDQLCLSTFRHPQTHCVLKPMVRLSPWLFMNSYFLYSTPVSICFLLHILRRVFPPLSIFIAGVSFSLRVVASCNFLAPYRFQISLCSASSGSLFTENGLW